MSADTEIARREELDELRRQLAESRDRGSQRALRIVQLRAEIRRVRGVADEAIEALHAASRRHEPRPDYRAAIAATCFAAVFLVGLAASLGLVR